MSPAPVSLFAVLKGLHLAALMMLFGSAALLLRLRRSAPELGIENRGLRRARLAAAVIAPATMLIWLTLERGNLFEPVFEARLALMVALAAAVVLRREMPALLLSGAALVLVSVTSHAAAASPVHFAAIGIAADSLHLLCGGIWIGGLAVLAATIAERPRAPRLLNVLSQFSDRAMIAVALLVLTGMLSGATILLEGEGHASRLYVGVLAAKLVLVAAMLGLALVNQFRLMPQIGRGRARASLRGNIIWELGLGAAVIALAALLGVLTPML